MGGEEKAGLLFINTNPSIFPRTGYRALHTLYGQVDKRTSSIYSGQGAMTSLWKHLACLLVITAIYPAIFLVSFVIQYAQTVLPPGIDQALRLRVCHTWLLSGILLGIVIEALGLSSFPEMLRVWTNVIRLLRDPFLAIREQNFDGVPVRIYSPKTGPTAKGKAVLFCHGGAGIAGSFDVYERFLWHIAKEGNSTVFAVGYRLAPESPFPTQYVDCLKAAIFLMKHAEDYGVDSSRIIISGDSFGGTVATRICQLLVDRSDLPKVHAQVLLYPALQGLDFCLPSYQQNHRSPFLWRKLVPFLGCYYFNKPTSFVDDFLKNGHVPEATRLKYQKWVSAAHIPERFKARGYTPPESHFNPRLHEESKELFTETCSPLLAEDAVIAKLPQTFLLTCEYDVLRDDGLLYMKRLTDNRVQVTWSHIENGTHAMALLYGFCFLSPLPANRMVHDITDFIRRL